ncbi:MAG: DUF3110 domain-containing protein [Leptolyngbya sp. SIO4C1]|nr:DUF3110 domain-containing protein [Leptolyngbya sp. SIO4C1]
MQVFVLIFNARTENEGIHTLRVGDRNAVLMFEEEDDALRFAGLLEAQDFPEASVEAFEQTEIEEFCEGAGYEAKLIPTGTLLMPPEQNVDQTDWNPNATPEQRAEAEQKAKDISDAELDRIRQQLEKLL